VNRGNDDRPEPSRRLRYVATMCVMLAVAVLVVRRPDSHATVVVAAPSLPVVVWSFVKDLREIRRFPLPRARSRRRMTPFRSSSPANVRILRAPDVPHIGSGSGRFP